MSVVLSDGSASKLLTLALLSASASAALTYAALKVKSLLDKKRSPAKSHKYTDHSTCCAIAPSKRNPYDPSPRSGYLSWDDYFMAVAFLSAQRSKDPNKQVGACIVDQSQVICGIGYNGFPRGCPDDELPWAKKARGGDPLGTKYPYVCHAEMNALLNKNGASVAGAKIYVTLFPCNECAKLLIQAGISEIIYHEDKLAPKRPPSPSKDGFRPDQQYAASRKLLGLAGVKLRQHRFRNPVTLRLTNHPAYPVMRSVDSAAVAAAAEMAAGAAGGSVAGAAGENVGAANGRHNSGAAGAGAVVGTGGAGAGVGSPAGREPSHAEVAAAAAAAAAAATAAVMAALPLAAVPGGGDLGGSAAAAALQGRCVSPLLSALSHYRQQLNGAAGAAAAAAAVSEAGGSTPRGVPSGSAPPSPEKERPAGAAPGGAAVAGTIAAAGLLSAYGAAAAVGSGGEEGKHPAGFEGPAGEEEVEEQDVPPSASSSGVWQPAAEENVGLA